MSRKEILESVKDMPKTAYGQYLLSMIEEV